MVLVVVVEKETGEAELDLDEDLLSELPLPLDTPGTLAATKTATSLDGAPH